MCQTNPGRLPSQPDASQADGWSGPADPISLPPTSSLTPLFPLARLPLHCLLTLPARAFAPPKTCHTCCFFLSPDYPPGGVSLACKRPRQNLGESRQTHSWNKGNKGTSPVHSRDSIHGACASGPVRRLGLKLWGHVVRALLSPSAWTLHVALCPARPPQRCAVPQAGGHRVFCRFHRPGPASESGVPSNDASSSHFPLLCS